MRRSILWLVSFLFTAANLYGQIGWFEQSIAVNYRMPVGLFAIDMDGDGDIDLVTASYGRDKVSWWENNGNQQFTGHDIDSLWDGAYQVHAGDLNGDGDMDIIAVAYLSNEVAWYENGGQMTFTKYTLVTNYDGPHFVRMTDVDDDNDMDIVTCAFSSGDISWWENTGYPNFTRHIIDTSFVGCRQIDVFDLDNDDDIDILASSEGVNQLAWYENNGNQAFQKRVIQDVYSAFWAEPYDFDNDSDWDILSCATFYGWDGDISWFENDGSMNFSRHIIDDDLGGPQSVEAADLDLDGDLDIVAAIRYDDGISWWENDLDSSFTKHNLSNNMDYAVSVLAEDIDLDGDADIFGAAIYTHNINWWQNLTVLVPGVVNGVVSDNYGSPMENVYVEASSIDIFDYTDQYGHYDLSLPPSVFDISFTKSGYYNYVIPDLPATSGDTTTLNVIMYLEMPGIWGRILNEQSVPVESVLVSVVDTSISVYSDYSGEFTIEGLVEGVHDILFQHPPYYSDTTITGISVEPGPWDTLLVVLEFNDALTGFAVGNVIDEYTLPLDDVYLFAENNIFNDSTDEYGDYSMEIVAGTYDITFTKPGYYNATVSDVEITAQDTVLNDITMYLEMPGVWGRIFNEHGAPVESVLISVPDTPVSVYSDDEGEYILEGLLQGANDIIFHHQYYTDTTITDFVEPGPWDTLNVILKGNGLVTGFVGDLDSTPVADVRVSTTWSSMHPFLNSIDFTDSTGQYFLHIIPEHSYTITFSRFNYSGQYLQNIMVAIGETLTLDPVYLQFCNTDVMVWYGNLDLSPIAAPIGGTILLDVYAKIDVQYPYNPYVGFVHLALATNDRYIVGHHSGTQGVFYYPLTDWDDAQFLPSDELMPGWHYQSMLCFCDISGDPNPPLYCPDPVRIATFAFEVANDTSLIGDTVNCFMEGYSLMNGWSFFGDTNGTIPYYPCQLSSPLYFVSTPTGECDYVAGDVNGSDDYNGLDITYGVSFFKGGPEPMCPFHTCQIPPCDLFFYCGDVNGGCDYNGLDITYGVAYLKGGAAPVPCSDCPPVE